VPVPAAATVVADVDRVAAADVGRVAALDVEVAVAAPRQSL
jgi:hypothetical protein